MSERTCIFDECDRPAIARGLCNTHYNKASRDGTLPPKLRPAYAGQPCSIDGCDTPATTKGMCIKHYARQLKWGDPHRVRTKPTCAVEECSRPVKSKGFCFMHHGRWIRTGSPHLGGRPVQPPHCIVEGCAKSPDSRGMCKMHQSRLARTGTTDPRPQVNRRISTGGYWQVRAEGHAVSSRAGWAYEHRVVLFDKIGPGLIAECHWCSTELRWDHTYPKHLDAVVADHLDENKLNNAPENLVPSCARCNLARSPRKNLREAS